MCRPANIALQPAGESGCLRIVAPAAERARYTDREKESRELIREMSMTAGRTLRPVRVLILFIESLVLAWAIVTLGNYFGWHLGPRSLF